MQDRPLTLVDQGFGPGCSDRIRDFEIEKKVPDPDPDSVGSYQDQVKISQSVFRIRIRSISTWIRNHGRRCAGQWCAGRWCVGRWCVGRWCAGRRCAGR